MRIPFFIGAMSVSVLIATPAPQGFAEETADRPQESTFENEITFLGVSTFHIAPSLREYLEISKGFGIQVLEVLPDSPAANAGLKKNDILLQFNDQHLISPEHLSILVKQEKPSHRASITLIRKGNEETVTVLLSSIDSASQRVRPSPRDDRMSPERWQEHLQTQQDYWQRWMNQRQPDRNPGSRDTAISSKTPDEAGRPPAVSVRPGFPVRIFGAEGVLKIDNDEGEVSIFHEEGGHRIVITDREGGEVYSGNYDSELGIESLPEEAQDHLRLMKLDNLEILAPRIAGDTPERTSAPMPPLSDGEGDGVL